jgi:hypothetical protein
VTKRVRFRLCNTHLNERIIRNIHANIIENADYKKKRMQAKTNRAFDCDGFGKPLHTCGSITKSQHKANLVKLIYFVYRNIFVYKFL